ncbi:peptidoglycan editing factor PgeF [Blastomonas fulva]|jgi:YfiH family protein|uniref:peptidoglycan editing factor PgeF n=1 Tax=Blastomonas fulva TaxID=1550728 RepID=UPI003D2DBE43
MSVPLLTSPALGAIAHGFTGRRGGVSTGLVAGLNVGLGSDDDPAAVAQNRRLATEAILPGAALVTLHQVHSADVIRVNAAIPIDDRPKADAMVTDRPGLLLGVLGADCPPILFADEAAQIIGAAHSGWKGAFAGVGEATVAAMEKLGADRTRIVAAIGPCIQQKSYEVDSGFYVRFCEADPENERFFREGRPDHYQFYLEGFIASRLAQCGIGTVHVSGVDTYSDAAGYYSFRRATHRGEPDYGRQMGAIGLRS